MRIKNRGVHAPSSFQATESPSSPPVETLLIHKTVADFLVLQLQAPAAVRGGLIFGFQEGNSLLIALASSDGLPFWYDSELRNPLMVDERFIHGWMEALSRLWGRQVGWFGNWVAHRTSQFPSDKWIQKKGKECGQLRQLNPSHVLMVIGWDRQDFLCQLYASVDEGSMLPLSLLEDQRPLADALPKVGTVLSTSAHHAPAGSASHKPHGGLSKRSPKHSIR